jgi:hypothetical protein
MWWLYALIDPRDGYVRYIGVTCTPIQRAQRHRWGKYASSIPLTRWFRELREAGGQKAFMVTLSQYAVEADAKKVEAALIRRLELLGFPTLNFFGSSREASVEEEYDLSENEVVHEASGFVVMKPLKQKEG